MAEQDEGRISNNQYIALAGKISAPSMESIAQGYLDIDPEVIASIKHENLNKWVPSNSAILSWWANKPGNSGPDQRKKLARILYEAADGGSYVNPTVVENILGFTVKQANAAAAPAPTSVPPDLVPAVTSPPVGGAAASGQDARELTIPMLMKLSKKFSANDEIYSLTLIGLRMNEDVVEGHLRNHREDIHGAVFKILKDWRDSQSDFKIAYEKLCAALRHDQVNKHAYIKEALQ